MSGGARAASFAAGVAALLEQISIGRSWWLKRRWRYGVQPRSWGRL